MLALKNVGTAAILAAGLALGSSAGIFSASAAPAAANLVTNQASIDSNLVEVRGGGGGRGGGGWRGGGGGGNWARAGNWGGRGWGRGYGYNRGYGYGRRYAYNGYGYNGAWLGLGLGGALLAGSLYDGGYGYDYRYSRPVYYGDGGNARCAARFRSFEPSTGMYTTYGGKRRMCPYLG